MPYESDRLPPLPILQPKSLVNGMLISEPDSKFLTRNPRAFASATITVAGSISNSDQLKVDVNLPALSGGKISKTITLTGSDTVSSAAQKLAKALNDDTVLQSYGAYANSLLGVVTFFWPGQLGNNVTLTQSVPVGAETITLGNAGVLAGGTGPIIPFNTFNFEKAGHFTSYQAGKPKIVGANVVKSLAAAGKPIQ